MEQPKWWRVAVYGPDIDIDEVQEAWKPVVETVVSAPTLTQALERMATSIREGHLQVPE